MIELIVLVLVILVLINFCPVKKLKVAHHVDANISQYPEIFRYMVIVHVHTQFSFDSLGKPSDIKKAMEENNIDFVFITDHNNDNYRYFENDRVFAGVEKNTSDGRLLLLGGRLPVISHPHNFDFEHYKWKGEFKQGYLYEFIDLKDVIVWNKFKTAIKLLANIIIYPLTRRITYKWNCLIPMEKWRNLYYSRAKHLSIIGGLDFHVKFVYQEKTHGVLIPSYTDGFKWVANVVYSKKKIENKDEILQALHNGNLYISINKNFIDIWAEDSDGIKLVGENLKKGGKVYVKLPCGKFVCRIFKDGEEFFTTNNHSFQVKLEESGKYWLEVYEYDFRVFGIYVGFRPVVITNSFWVV